MARDNFKSVVAVNIVCCLLGTSLFVLHTFLVTAQLYGHYASEFSAAFLVVFALCVAVALVFTLLGLVAFLSACRRRQWANRRATIGAIAAIVLPFPAMLLAMQVAAGFSKWWIMNS